MNKIFNIVYHIVIWLSELTGFTYREMNIIVYFIILPFIYFALIDRTFKFHYAKIGFSITTILALIAIPDFKSFSSLLFDKSVDFLNWFDVLGWNYIEASVIICVVLPVLLLIFFFYLIPFFNKRNNLVS